MPDFKLTRRLSLQTLFGSVAASGSLSYPTAPAPPPPDPGAVDIQTITVSDTSKIIMFGTAYQVTGSYDRFQHMTGAVLSGSSAIVTFRGWSFSGSTVARNFSQATAYTLMVDGVAKATATPGTGVSIGSFTLDMTGISEGWHILSITGTAVNETAIPHGFYVLKSSLYVDVGWLPVVTGTYEYTQTGPGSPNYDNGLTTKQFHVVKVPSVLNRRSVPLDKRLMHDRVGFTTLENNNNLVAYQLVPVKFGDRHNPSISQPNGILNTYATQDYFYEDFLNQRPKIAIHDGPRGIGTTKFVTSLRFSRRPDGRKIYGTDGWRLFVISEDGHIRTLAGWRHKDPPPHWQNPGVGGSWDVVWGANTEPQMELVGDWSSIPASRQGFYEPWGMDFHDGTLTVNTGVPVIDAGNDPMEQPHNVGPVAFVADTHHNRIIKVQFKPDMRDPGVCTEFITGLFDPWDVIYDAGKLIISERTAHKISVYNATTGAWIEDLVTSGGADYAGLAPSRFTYLRLKPDTAGTVITNVTRATSPVATYSGPDIFADGDRVLFAVASGMTALNGVTLTAASVNTTTKTFTLVGLDANGTQAYPTWVSGTVTRYYRYAEAQVPDVQGPEGMDLVNGVLYYGSSSMRCIKKINLTTRVVSMHLQLDRAIAKATLGLSDSQVANFPFPDINSNFLNFSISDGTFGPEGTAAIATWSVAFSGIPVMITPNNLHWDTRPGTSTAGQGPAGVGYVSATAIKNGMMVYGGAEEGMCFLAFKGAQDIPLINLGGTTSTGKKNYLAAGYHLAYGIGGYGYFDTDLPWGVNANIDAYLKYNLHVRVPTWRRGAAVNQWMALPSSSITGDADGRLAFSGAALQSTQIAEVLWLGPGGGHNDNSDNSVRSMDLLADAPAVTLRLAATPLAQRTLDASYYADGRPAARHLYSSMYWSKRWNKLFTLGVRSSYGGGGFFSGKVDGFNPGSNTWDAAGTHPDILAQARYSCMDSKGDVWSLQTPGANFGSALYHWGRNTKVQTMVIDFGTPAGGPLAFDTKREQIFSLSWGNGEDKFGTDVRAFVYRKLYSVTADTFNAAPTRSAITLNSIGGALAQFMLDRTEYGGMDYEPALDAFLFYDGRLFDGIDRRGRVYMIKPNAGTTWDISILATTGTPPHVKGAGVNNRWRYVPKLKGFLLYADGAQPLWFLPTEFI